MWLGFESMPLCALYVYFDYVWQSGAHKKRMVKYYIAELKFNYGLMEEQRH